MVFQLHCGPGLHRDGNEKLRHRLEYGTTPDGGTTLVKIGIAANPATTAASGTTSVSVQFTQGPPYGAVVFYARTMALDPNGNVVYSAVAVAPSAQLTPASPSNLVITVEVGYFPGNWMRRIESRANHCAVRRSGAWCARIRSWRSV